MAKIRKEIKKIHKKNLNDIYLFNLCNSESEIIANMNVIPERQRHGFGVPPSDSVWSN